MIEEVDVARMESLVRDGALLVDVREKEELATEGQIPGMVHMPLSNFESLASTFPKDRPVVFYCRSGRRSLTAADMAEEWTDQHLYSLAGGILGYKTLKGS